MMGRSPSRAVWAVWAVLVAPVVRAARATVPGSPEALAGLLPVEMVAMALTAQPS